MSGQHRLAVSELSTGANAKLTGKAYLDSVAEEMLDADEGAAEELDLPEESGETPKVDNI